MHEILFFLIIALICILLFKAGFFEAIGYLFLGVIWFIIGLIGAICIISLLCIIGVVAIPLILITIVVCVIIDAKDERGSKK